MTTPAKPECPERVADAAVDEDVMFIGRLLPEVACRALARIANELRGARAEESRLSRELEATEHLIDAYASELGTLVCQVLEADGRARGYREAARRLAGCLGLALQADCAFAFDYGMNPPLAQTECVYCGATAEPLATKEAEFARWRQHALECPQHPMRAVEAERDATRKEAERLRNEMSTMRPDLGWDDNEFK